jgi:hypothetical protein
MHRTICSWTEFKMHWNGVHNFLMEGDCIPFSFDVPPIERVIDEMRKDPSSSIGPGVKGRSLNLDSIADKFRKLPIDKAMMSQFSLAHYRLSQFDAPGKFLYGFETRVLQPWQEALKAANFTWTRCYPIVFISGAHCATNYHMDFSHVLAWQIHGTKRFCGLIDPDRWAPRDVRLSYDPARLPMPEAITPAHSLCYEMKPGDVLWNCLLTPHWVEASDQVAMSINISHGGLRLNGCLCPFEQELEEFRQANPDAAPKPVAGRY